jgi:hypothetical protein
VRLCAARVAEVIRDRFHGALRHVRSWSAGRGRTNPALALAVAVLVVAALLAEGTRSTVTAAVGPRRGLFLNPDQSAATIARQLDHYRNLHVNHVEVTADFSFLCPGKLCDLHPLDVVIAAAAARGMTVALQVDRTPDAVDPRGPAFGPDTAATRAGWVALFRKLVVRYRTRVAYYEIWNEPDSPRFWQQGPDPHAYALLLHDAYSAAKAIDPAVQIVGGNLSDNSVGFLRLTYDAMDRAYGQNQAKQAHYYFDVLGVHPYAGGDGFGLAPDAASRDQNTVFGPVDRSYLGFRRMRALTAKREAVPKPLAFGEFGYSTTPGFYGPVSDDVRARYLTRVFQLATQAGYVRYLTWYDHDSTEADSQGFVIHGTATERALARVGAAQ